MTEWDQIRPLSVCLSVLRAGHVSTATWRCTQDCFGLVAEVTIIFRVQWNELHPRLTTEACTQGLQRSRLALAEGHVADAFPWRLAKLATLEMANVYLYILSCLFLMARSVALQSWGTSALSLPMLRWSMTTAARGEGAADAPYFSPMSLWPRATTC